ncbi:MAG: zinc-binding dehydrogenase [Chloroflexi bacterium]|nr:zinc-binding dehydrogenase [Chloroflexota bacterium]
METCKAAVFVGAGKPLAMQEFPVPPLEPGAVLIKSLVAAVCATDVHAFHNPRAPHPVIWGHENVGAIARLGKGVTTDAYEQALKEGDRVIYYPATCGRCFNCLAGGLPCEVRRNYGLRPFTTPPHITGGFGQYVYVEPNALLLRIPDDMSTERALFAVIGNHTVMNGLEKLGGISVSDAVVVQGSGPVGMGALTQAKLAGARRVIVVGAPAGRLQMAREMGADETVSIEEYREPEARAQRVRELTDGRGADMVIECSGADTAFQEGLEMVRAGGKYLNLGQLTDYGPMPVNPSLITRKSILISGVLGPTFKHVTRALHALHARVKYPVEKLITHEFPLQRVNEAFRVHETLEAMVAVVRPNG